MTFGGFKPAVRESVGLLIGIAGASGSGKTYSAMRLAQGMSGGRRFAVIDTEAGRAKHYADQFAFDHGDLRAPFNPFSYAEAIKAADEAGYPVIVVDSFSHEHAGDGGLLDMHEAELDRMAGNDWKKRDRVKGAAWIKPKGEHKRMLSRLLQVRAHLILCFRAEEKIDFVKDENGKLQIVPKKTLSGFEGWVPICESRMPYELTASLLMLPNRPGYPIHIKVQQQHLHLFPTDRVVDEKSGEEIAAWASGGVEPANTDPLLSAEQAQQIRTLLAFADDEAEERLLENAKVETIEQIPARFHASIVERLKGMAQSS